MASLGNSARKTQRAAREGARGRGQTAAPRLSPHLPRGRATTRHRLVPHVSGVSLGVFSRASFAIQPRPRLRTLLDGAGPQAHGVAGMRKTTCAKLYTFRPRLLRTLTGERCRLSPMLSPATPAMRPQWPHYS
eukprot:scaffold50400_cov63-Phaeocystis_antarctica.AAC.1